MKFAAAVVKFIVKLWNYSMTTSRKHDYLPVGGSGYFSSRYWKNIIMPGK